MVQLLPGTQSTGSQAQEDGADKFAKWSSIDWFQLVIRTVSQVVCVESGSRKADTFSRLVIVN